MKIISISFYGVLLYSLRKFITRISHFIIFDFGMAFDLVRTHRKCTEEWRSGFYTYMENIRRWNVEMLDFFRQ